MANASNSGEAGDELLALNSAPIPHTKTRANLIMRTADQSSTASESGASL